MSTAGGWAAPDHKRDAASGVPPAPARVSGLARQPSARMASAAASQTLERLDSFGLARLPSADLTSLEWLLADLEQRAVTTPKERQPPVAAPDLPPHAPAGPGAAAGAVSVLDVPHALPRLRLPTGSYPDSHLGALGAAYSPAAVGGAASAPARASTRAASARVPRAGREKPVDVAPLADALDQEVLSDNEVCAEDDHDHGLFEVGDVTPRTAARLALEALDPCDPDYDRKRDAAKARQRRAKNRVNAELSRRKRENYITYLESKAGVPGTKQGTSERKRAVERAWLEVKRNQRLALASAHAQRQLA